MATVKSSAKTGESWLDLSRGNPSARKDRVFRAARSAAGLCAVAALLFMVFFIISGSVPALRLGLSKLLEGQWAPSSGSYGLAPMLVGSVLVTAGAVLLSSLPSVAAALYLSEYAPGKVRRLIEPAIDLLAGIPSVVYGLFGMTALVPLIRTIESWLVGPAGPASQKVGYSVLSAQIVLAVMISPVIISMCKEAFAAVPASYREASVSLGATRWQTAFHIVFEAGASGVKTAILTGIGRALGETMAVLMVAGNAPIFPSSLFSPVRTLTSNIAAEIGYAGGLHESALYAGGVLLLLVVAMLAVLAGRVGGARQ